MKRSMEIEIIEEEAGVLPEKQHQEW